MQSRWSRPWTFREDEAEDDEKEEKAFNMTLDPSLVSVDASGVVALTVCQKAAQECAATLESDWLNGCLKLPSLEVKGFNTYTTTLAKLDSEQQRLHTLLVTEELLPSVRSHLPGFHAMECEIVKWLEEHYETKVELFQAHGLRQGPRTMSSTGFAVHQDNEIFKFIEYSVVVKLTPDEPDEVPSAMRVVGAPVHFKYGNMAGACGCFLAGLYHASVEPRSERDHLKMTFFFRHKAAAHEAKKLQLKLPEHGFAAEGDRSVLATDKSKSTPRGSRADTQPQQLFALQTGGWSGREFVSPMGVTILVGRNCAESEQLSLKIARDPDVWFHVRDAPGAHVVLRMSQLPEGSVAHDDCMQMAANLAAFYSERRDEHKALVAYTSPRHITKPNGAPLGVVVARKEDGTICGRPADSVLLPKSIVIFGRPTDSALIPRSIVELRAAVAPAKDEDRGGDRADVASAGGGEGSESSKRQLVSGARGGGGVFAPFVAPSAPSAATAATAAASVAAAAEFCSRIEEALEGLLGVESFAEGAEVLLATFARLQGGALECSSALTVRAARRAI